MIGASYIVGIHDVGRPPSPSDLTVLTRAFPSEAPVHTRSAGPLALAWIGERGPSSAGVPRAEPIVVLAGQVYDLGVSSASAGEALARVCEATGEEVLRDLRGDFSLVAYDEETGRGLLAGDHLGARGWVWHRQGQRLRFATELRHLLPVLPSRPGPDPAALGHWLSMSGIPRGRTLYDGILRLDAAHALRFGDGPERAHRYWSPVYVAPEGSDVEALADGLRAALGTAVRRRCADGSDTAVLLSGGLDSSSVAALGAGLDEPARLKRAYSATFPWHPSIDESGLIDELCRHLGLHSTRAVVRSGSVLGGAIEYIRRWDQPPPSPNLFFWLPLLRRASGDGVAVLLDGEGGDELFGLSPYLLADLLRRGRVRTAAALVRRMPGGGPHVNRSTQWRYIREFGLKGIVPHRLHRAIRRVRGPSRYTPSWLRPEPAEAYMATDEWWRWKQIPGPRWWAFLVEVVTQGMGPALTYDHVRLRAAQSGLDARHPLVDVDVIEYVLRIPPALTYDPRFSRPLLRQAMAGRLPDPVRLRPSKSTFDAVFHEALAGPDLPVARSLLDPDGALLAAYVDLVEVQRRLFGRVPPPGAGRQHWALALWRLVTAECWLRAQSPDGVDRGLERLSLDRSDLAIVVRAADPGLDRSDRRS